MPFIEIVIQWVQFMKNSHNSLLQAVRFIVFSVLVTTPFFAHASSKPDVQLRATFESGRAYWIQIFLKDSKGCIAQTQSDPGTRSIGKIRLPIDGRVMIDATISKSMKLATYVVVSGERVKGVAIDLVSGEQGVVHGRWSNFQEWLKGSRKDDRPTTAGGEGERTATWQLRMHAFVRVDKDYQSPGLRNYRLRLLESRTKRLEDAIEEQERLGESSTEDDESESDPGNPDDGTLGECIPVATAG